MNIPSPADEAAPAQGAGSVRVSIVIKALNEEQHIGAALSSALAALESVSVAR